MAKTKLYQAIARALRAMKNCQESAERARKSVATNAVDVIANALEWEKKHKARAKALWEEESPSGSGIDAGAELDLQDSRPDRLVFRTAFHHMDEHGGYDGWTNHDVIVRPSLPFGIELRITGRDRNQIKNHLHEVFELALNAEVEEFPEKEGAR